jgi:D-3-phosphoglycerate dehydrogenase / 2-oxoglutarate reductase
MKILIADAFEEIGRAELERLGHEVLYRPGIGGELVRVVAELDPDVLVVRSTTVSGDAIRAGKRLKLVVRAGAGFDTIDVAAASTEGVPVANCPGKNAIAVAELTWALILACDRRVPDQTAELRAGQWNKKEYGAARGLFGRTLGVLGLGPIAQAVIERGKAFGMEVVAWSRSLDDARAAELGVGRAASPVEVARQADVLTVHVASTAETRKLVSAEVIAALRPGAYVINTARGAVLDEAALRQAIADKGLRAGLDVFDGEPKAGAAPFDSALARTPGVYGTHHIGASTDQAQTAIAMEAVRIVATFAASGEVLHCVNRARTSPATCLLTVRHRNRPGVLAKIFDVLSESAINVEEMENIIYDGAAAACARIQLDTAPDAAALGRMCASSPEILSIDLSSIA